MGFLIGAIIMFIVVICIALSDSDRDSSVVLAMFSVITVGMFIGFAFSNMMAHHHIEAYRSGRFQKEYTIKGEDTTYKWVKKPVKK